MEDLKSVPPESDCTQCGHPFDDHLLWAARNPLEGGAMTCPVVTEGVQCECLGTWDVAR